MGYSLERGMNRTSGWMDLAAEAVSHRDRPVTELGIDELVEMLLEDKARGFEVVRLEGRGTLYTYKPGHRNVLMATERQI